MLLEEKLMRERKSGYEEGIAKGEARGKAKGIAEGESKALKKMAEKLLAHGMDIDKISQLTGLDEAEARKLSKTQ